MAAATSMVDEWISFRVREGLRNIYMEVGIWAGHPADFFRGPKFKMAEKFER